MKANTFKYNLFNQFARVGKALSNPNRLELLEFLAQSARSVDTLAKLANLSIANTSQHLQHLRQAGLVTSEKDGLKVYYSISGDDVISLLDSLRDVAERHISDVDKLVNTYLTAKDNLDPVPAAELLERVKLNLVTVLDVRPKEEFDAGHIQGAMNIPLEELEQQLQQFDPDQEIVAYCRGPHCILAFDAVAQLRKSGFQAYRLDSGYPEWKLAGLPVEKNISNTH
ncbi:MAG: metalloregulator ArsR/SmtB family transcription factor [Gammaproteobacteria bacterium]|nr:metalloregulator ArsR/SmtB family transcription factor [Gammaproteobacteria bacterium]MCW8987120.1 metalloregulator ArsR/SmtB family transcription factor [Gammaproteobacteria bacterium]MCW9030484.1 metalloregulator ArsR/SmtB family transcription factor [Gammaproteobacteria bacterium]